MTSQQQADIELSLWQAYARTEGARVADAMISEMFAPAEYTATMDLVRSAMSEVELRTCIPMNERSLSSDFSQSV